MYIICVPCKGSVYLIVIAFPHKQCLIFLNFIRFIFHSLFKNALSFFLPAYDHPVKYQKMVVIG